MFDLALFSCLRYQLYVHLIPLKHFLSFIHLPALVPLAFAFLTAMNLLGISVVLVLLVGVWAQINVLRPECDSPEAEELALVAQDYINNQHTQGYKYALNRIEDIKVYTTVSQQVWGLCRSRIKVLWWELPIFNPRCSKLS